MSGTIYEQVREMAADVFMVEREQVNAETSPQSLESWDSVQHLSLVLALEEKFALQFSPEEIDQMQSIGQVVGLVERKLGQA